MLQCGMATSMVRMTTNHGSNSASRKENVFDSQCEFSNKCRPFSGPKVTSTGQWSDASSSTPRAATGQRYSSSHAKIAHPNDEQFTAAPHRKKKGFCFRHCDVMRRSIFRTLKKKTFFFLLHRSLRSVVSSRGAVDRCNENEKFALFRILR